VASRTVMQILRRTTKWICLVGATATLGMGASWTESRAQEGELRPNEIVARLFPREWSPPQGQDAAQRTVFDPKFNSYSALTHFGPPPTMFDILQHVPARPAEAPAAARSAALLNDAQIVSIKERLRLTPSQQRYWAAVETALRALVWRKNPAGAASLDATSVQRLNVAARELAKHLSESQKREVQTLAHLVGLKDQH
jgi:hypothetical protein